MPGQRSRRGSGAWGAMLLSLCLWLVGMLPLQAAPLELQDVKATHSGDGVHLSFTADFALPRAVEEALLKGVPLHFIAEARLYRSRWYWRDLRVVRAVRHWRLSYQPLTRRYRVNFDALGQNYDSLPEALGAIHRTMGWKIADPESIQGGGHHYVELDYRLDLSQLPRPFQIGIDGQADWQFEASETVRLESVPR